MFRTEPGPDRELLGFKDAVLAGFEFLSSYGLKPKKREATLVRYESKKTFVEVYHGHSSFEIGISVGRRDRPERYGLDYVVSWAGKAAWEAEGFGRGVMFQVSSREGVDQIVPKVAGLLQKYGEPFLRGDPEFYDTLAKANERASMEYTRRQMIEDTRKDAEYAWAEKNYARVAELYQPLREDLTIIEAKRLAYAEKQVLRTHVARKRE
jgi:hypothetical protein